MSARVSTQRGVQTASRRAVKVPFGLRPVEIVVALAMIIIVILVAYYYVSTLQPEQERLAALQQRDAELTKQLADAQTKSQEPKTVDAAQMALDSLNVFKEKRLKPQMRGEVALYKDINSLAKKHNLQLVSGIEMNRQGRVQEEDGKAGKKGDEILRVYPETNIQFTVAGDYAKIRAFIAELEQNQQFLILNSINLLTVENEEGGQGGQGGRSGRGGRRGGAEAVGLAIDMTAYFHP